MGALPIYSAIVVTLIFLLRGSIFTHPDISAYAINNIDSSKNQTKLGDNFMIEFSREGGFVPLHTSLSYNSTNNHLLEKNMASNETLSDTQLGKEQQKTLKKAIEESNFFNIKNSSIVIPCQDCPYFILKVTSENKTNTIGGYDLISGLTNLVDILYEFADNATQSYSQPEKK
jgi:hypothetical protein